jgi:ankyrin repeat protein
MEAFMSKISLDEALSQLGPTFFQEVRKRVTPVWERFFAPPTPKSPDQRKDGLITPPPYMTEPDLRKVAIELAELALERGIDVNVACEEDGSTFLHLCTLLRGPAIAVANVEWLLAHGADPNRRRDDGETPFSLAVRFGRTEVEEVMRAHGNLD